MVQEKCTAGYASWFDKLRIRNWFSPARGHFSKRQWDINTFQETDVKALSSYQDTPIFPESQPHSDI